jgi:hypothetical protein
MWKKLENLVQDFIDLVSGNRKSEELQKVQVINNLVDTFEVDSRKIVEAVGDIKDPAKRHEYEEKADDYFSKSKYKIIRFVDYSYKHDASFVVTVKGAIEMINTFWLRFVNKAIKDHYLSKDSLNSDMLTFGEKEDITKILADNFKGSKEKSEPILQIIIQNIIRNKSLDMLAEVRKQAEIGQKQTKLLT